MHVFTLWACNVQIELRTQFTAVSLVAPSYALTTWDFNTRSPEQAARFSSPAHIHLGTGHLAEKSATCFVESGNVFSSKIVLSLFANCSGESYK